jgi:hypothetical protein
MLADRVRMGSGKSEFKDIWGTPGSAKLIAGDGEAGFFGEVPASELITGDALASQVGISQGTSQHSTAGWLKFVYKGEILFVAKRPIRHSVNRSSIISAKCVYGDSGDKTVVIGGKTYKVTLMRGTNDKFDPKQIISEYNSESNHGSEWNRLMCQIHEQALNKSWDYPNNIESDIGILEHSLGNGSQGMYNDADLGVKSGNGRYSWCQESVAYAFHYLGRGADGVSSSNVIPAPHTAGAEYGWRPVLRLV